MATLFKQLSIPAPIDTVWSRIADIGGIHNLMSMLTSAHVDGDRRVCTTVDGSQLEERILSVDPELKRIAYAITQSPFNFEFHAASWQLRADGTSTILEWFTDLKPDTAADMVSHVIESERDHLITALSQAEAA